MTLYLSFNKTFPNAKTPERFEDGSAGYDLFSSEIKNIPPHEIVSVDTGIHFQMQGSFCGNIRDKSLFVTKKKLMVIESIVHPSDVNSVQIYFYNLSNIPQTIFKGERIAQIIFQNILLPKLVYN